MWGFECNIGVEVNQIPVAVLGEVLRSFTSNKVEIIQSENSKSPTFKMVLKYRSLIV